MPTPAASNLIQAGKDLLASRTFWANAIAFVLAGLNVLPKNQYTVAIVAVVNIALRLVTGTPITSAGGSKLFGLFG